MSSIGEECETARHYAANDLNDHKTADQDKSNDQAATAGLPQLGCVIVSMPVVVMARMIAVIIVPSVVMASVGIVAVTFLPAVVMASVRIVVVAHVLAVVMPGVGIVVVTSVPAVVISIVSALGLSHNRESIPDVSVGNGLLRSAVEPGRGFQVPQVTVFAAIGGRLADLYRHLAYVVLIVDQAAHLTQEMF